MKIHKKSNKNLILLEYNEYFRQLIMIRAEKGELFCRKKMLWSLKAL